MCSQKKCVRGQTNKQYKRWTLDIMSNKTKQNKKLFCMFATTLIDPHKCVYCKECFNNDESLKGHINEKHVANRPYPCDVCHRRFKERHT